MAIPFLPHWGVPLVTAHLLTVGQATGTVTSCSTPALPGSARARKATVGQVEMCSQSHCDQTRHSHIQENLVDRCVPKHAWTLTIGFRMDSEAREPGCFHGGYYTESLHRGVRFVLVISSERLLEGDMYVALARQAGGESLPRWHCAAVREMKKAGR